MTRDDYARLGIMRDNDGMIMESWGDLVLTSDHVGLHIGSHINITVRVYIF
jgi:hypothetical protein